jgi:ATP-binding cassette subfamily F protein 3
MLNVVKITKSYGVETLLDQVSLVINAGDRAALIGENGCGKSTLLDIIAGEDAPDRGRVSIKTGVRIGYLHQDLDPAPEDTVAQTVRAGLGKWDELRGEVDGLSEKISHARGDELEIAIKAYDEALARFQLLGGYEIDYQIKSILAHLGMEGVDLETPVRQLSGGEQTRVGLAAVLIAKPDLLLLDEPTNHLDINALEWLEAWLIDFNGAALLVSHDRTFLDKTVTSILELQDGVITEYKGDYAHYAQEKEAEHARQWAAYKDQQDEIRRIRGDIHRTKMHAKSVELTTTSREPGVAAMPRRWPKKPSHGRRNSSAFSSQMTG